MGWVCVMCPHHKYQAHSLSESRSKFWKYSLFQWQHCFYLDIYNIYPFRRKWFCNLEPPSAPLFRGIQCLGLATESRGLLPDETRHVRKKSFTFSFPHFLHRHVETLATFDQSWDRQAHGNCLMTKLSCCRRLKSSVLRILWDVNSIYSWSLTDVLKKR